MPVVETGTENNAKQWRQGLGEGQRKGEGEMG